MNEESLSGLDRRWIAEMDEALGAVERIWRHPPSAREVVTAVHDVTGCSPDRLLSSWKATVNKEQMSRLALCVVLLEDTDMDYAAVVGLFPEENGRGRTQESFIRDAVTHYYTSLHGSYQESRPIVQKVREVLGVRPGGRTLYDWNTQE